MPVIFLRGFTDGAADGAEGNFNWHEKGDALARRQGAELRWPGMLCAQTDSQQGLTNVSTHTRARDAAADKLAFIPAAGVPFFPLILAALIVSAQR